MSEVYSPLTCFREKHTGEVFREQTHGRDARATRTTLRSFEMKNILRFLVAASVFSIFCSAVLAQSASRDEVLKSLETKRAEIKALEEQFLAPSDEDRAAYAEFLSQPDTGLMRLLPRETYDNNKTFTIRGGGAYYSFSRRSNEYGFSTDIGLERNYLSVGFAGADYGMLTSLGDVPLESVTLANDRVMAASTQKIPGELADARVEQQRFSNGATINGVVFKRRLPAKLDSTYVLRSINYGETDVLVALRIVRQDNDGSLIIAWKLLNKYPKPELARIRSDQ